MQITNRIGTFKKRHPCPPCHHRHYLLFQLATNLLLSTPSPLYIMTLYHKFLLYSPVSCSFSTSMWSSPGLAVHVQVLCPNTPHKVRMSRFVVETPSFFDFDARIRNLQSESWHMSIYRILSDSYTLYDSPSSSIRRQQLRGQPWLMGTYCRHGSCLRLWKKMRFSRNYCTKSIIGQAWLASEKWRWGAQLAGGIRVINIRVGGIPVILISLGGRPVICRFKILLY